MSASGAFSTPAATLSGDFAYGGTLAWDESVWSPWISELLAVSGAAASGARMSGAFMLAEWEVEGQIADQANPVLPEFDLTGEIVSGQLAETAFYTGLLLPGVQLAAHAVAGSAASLEAEIPAVPMLEASAGIRAPVLPIIAGLELSGALIGGRVARGNPLLPAPSLLAEVRDSRADTLHDDGRLRLPGLSLSAESVAGSAGSAAFGIAPFALAGQAQGAGVATAGFTLPAVSLDAWARTETRIDSALLILPAIDLAASARSAPAPGAGEALVMNAATTALARYENFRFNSFAQYAGRQLAAMPGGVYALGGDDDDGEPIDMVIATPISDLGVQTLKRVREAFIGYRSQGRAELHVKADDDEWHVYALDETRGDGLYRNRVKVGRGIKGAYFQFRFINVDGAAFAIDAIEPVLEVYGSRTK